MAFQAEIYGFNLVCPQAFPGSVPCEDSPTWFLDSSPQFEVTYSRSVRGRHHDHDTTLESGAEFTRFTFPDGISITAQAGARWHSTCPAPYTPADAFCYLVGPVMPFVRWQQGYHTLHACVLTSPSGKTMAFCGTNGAGKSTLAAISSQVGWSLISDDTLMIDSDYIAQPGPNHVRLWSDTLQALGEDGPRLTPNWEKHYLSLPVGKPKRLAALVILEESPTVELSLLSGSEAVARVSAESYLWRFLDSSDRAQDFGYWADLVGKVDVYRGMYPRTIEGARSLLDALA